MVKQSVCFEGKEQQGESARIVEEGRLKALSMKNTEKEIEIEIE